KEIDTILEEGISGSLRLISASTTKFQRLIDAPDSLPGMQLRPGTPGAKSREPKAKPLPPTASRPDRFGTAARRHGPAARTLRTASEGTSRPRHPTSAASGSVRHIRTSGVSSFPAASQLIS